MKDMVHPGSQYTDDQRRAAAIQYAIDGTLTAVEKATGIPDSTLGAWKQQDWWNIVIQEAQAEIEERFRAKCHQIVDKATDSILERIEHGNEVHTKEGIRRLKVSAGELAKVGGIFYDKYRLSMNLPTSIRAGSGNNNAMKDLADQFRQLSESYQARDLGVISTQSGTDDAQTEG